MKKTILFILSLLVLQGCPTQPEPDEPVQREAVEGAEMVIHRSTGDIIATKSLKQTRMEWLRIFASDRYNDRKPNGDYIWPELVNITADTDWQEQWNGNEMVFNHIDTLSIDTLDVVEPWDSLSVEIDSVYYSMKKLRDDTYLSALQTFTESGFFAQLPEDVMVDGSPWYNTYPWGTKEIKVFAILRGEFKASFLDSLLFNQGKWRIALQTLRDSTNIENITIRQARDNLNLTVKEKTWVQDNIMTLPGINLDTTMLQLWQDDRVDKRIFRHPKILKAVKRYWISQL